MTDDQGTTRAVRNRRIVALVIGLVAPGAGQLVRGRPLRGAAWFLGVVAGAVLVPFVPYMPFVLFAVWLGALVDVLVMCQGPHIVPYPRSLIIVGGYVVVVAGSLLALRSCHVEAFRVPSTGMSPTLAIGDHVVANKSAYWLSSPQPGDVVVFHWPCARRVTYVQRVIARGGDTVEVRCGRVYVNGAALELEPDGARCTYVEQESADRWFEQTRCSRYRERGSYTIAWSDAEPGAARPLDFPRVAPQGPTRLPRCMGAAHDREPAGSFEAVEEARGPCDQQLAYRVPAGHLFVMGDNRDNSSDSRHWGPVPEADVVGEATMIWWSSNGLRGSEWDRIGGID